MNGRSGLAIERVAETGSTNSDLLERVHALAASAPATAGPPGFAPCVRVAVRQRAGRGRHGRSWHATPGASLTFSIAWPFTRVDLSGLSLAVGTSLADSLEPIGSPGRIRLKWPNDLWLLDDDGATGAAPGRKLGGVLIETAPFGRGRVAVVGIGLNVAAQQVDDAASGCAWWGEVEPGATPDAALERVLEPLAEALGRFERHGFAPFVAPFAARDLLCGKRVVATGAEGPVEGMASGVSPRGELLVRTDGGTVPVSSGEVRLRWTVDAHASPPQWAGSPC